MMIADLFHETYSAVTSNKARSALTILGIVIGISSVIAMVSIGQGAQSSIESRIQSIGSNLIIVTPGAQRGTGLQISSGRGSAQTLTRADAEAIAELTSVEAVSPEISGRHQITAKGANTNTSVIGTTPEYLNVRNLEIAEGNFISELNVKNLGKVAVIGPTTRDDLFGEGASVIGQSIRINKIDFKIIGVTQSKGSSGATNTDDIVYIPISTASRYLSGSEFVNSIYAKSATGGELSQTQTEITSLLLQRHNVSADAPDFTTTNQADIVATASSVTGTFTILLAAIAGISLLVGGIGIMNMMLTTVTERTREIGLRKAIGAKKADISIQFLVESITLTFLGGFIGIILGWTISMGVTQFAGIQTSVSLSSVLLAFGVSAIIGVVFGYYPARRAAALNPIEALRYE